MTPCGGGSRSSPRRFFLIRRQHAVDQLFNGVSCFGRQRHQLLTHPVHFAFRHHRRSFGSRLSTDTWEMFTAIETRHQIVKHIVDDPLDRAHFQGL
jgi:hypothetical protein